MESLAFLLVSFSSVLVGMLIGEYRQKNETPLEKNCENGFHSWSNWTSWGVLYQERICSSCGWSERREVPFEKQVY